MVYYNKNEYGKAIEDFNKAIELDNKFALAYNNRGMVYLNKKEYDKAIEDFNKAIEYFDKAIEFAFAFAYSNRGLAYFNKKEYDKAIEDFNKAIELDNKFALAYNNRGIVYLDRNKKDEYDKAIEDFNKAIELDNEFALAYGNRGLAYFYKKEYVKAFNNFKKFKPNEELNYMIKLFLINEKGINNIENLTIKYADSYFTSVIGKNIKIKINKNKLFKIWCYQYVLLDLLSIKNYQNIKEFSHYTSKKIFDILINNDEKNDNAYLRFTSISKANDPKEGEILKYLLSKNIENDINAIEEQNKDYLVFQTSFIRYTDSLTMFRLYGKDKEREGTGISLVFNNTFFDINELTTTSPAQTLGNPTNYDYEKENKRKNKKTQLTYIKVYPSIEPKYELLPLYFILYYDNKNNGLIYNPTDSTYRNKIINLDNLYNENIEYDENNNNITNNIKFILKKIFIMLKELESEELKIAYKLLINIRYLIKHSSFFEEQELRIIQLVKNDGNNVLFDKDINRLYLNYETPIFERDYLKKVIIGPKVEEAISLKEVYQHLIMKNKSNKNIDIEISDLPLN